MILLGNIHWLILLTLAAPTILAAVWFVFCFLLVAFIRTNQRPDAYEKRTD